jgi:hypothetical protein
MNHHLRLCLLGAALLCAVPLAAQAQLRPGQRVSHVPIPGDRGSLSPDAAEQYLNNRFEQAEIGRIIQDIAADPGKYRIGPRERKELQQALEGAGGQPDRVRDNPQFQRIVRQVAEEAKQNTAISAEDKKRLADFAGKLPLPPSTVTPGKPMDPRGGKPNVPPDQPPGTPTNSPSGSGQKPADPPPPSGSSGSSGPPPRDSSPASAPAQNNMREIADWLADSRFAESPTFRRMLLNLERMRLPEGPSLGAWDRRVERLGDRFAAFGSHLPDFSWPKFGSSPRGPGRRAAPSGPIEMPEVGSQVILLLVAVAACGLLIWAVLRRSGLRMLRRTEDGWKLGPWPVLPEAVRTRDDLVRAFQYLALLRFGLAACSRNHREIADGLGEGDSIHRAAAERLAGLYEQARYAPPDEALPDADLAGARADLSLLAGVAAA